MDLAEIARAAAAASLPVTIALCTCLAVWVLVVVVAVFGPDKKADRALAVLKTLRGRKSQ